MKKIDFSNFQKQSIEEQKLKSIIGGVEQRSPGKNSCYNRPDGSTWSFGYKYDYKDSNGGWLGAHSWTDDTCPTGSEVM